MHIPEPWTYQLSIFGVGPSNSIFFKVAEKGSFIKAKSYSSQSERGHRKLECPLAKVRSFCLYIFLAYLGRKTVVY